VTRPKGQTRRKRSHTVLLPQLSQVGKALGTVSVFL
jgi:hypothetical protein